MITSGHTTKLARLAIIAAAATIVGSGGALAAQTNTTRVRGTVHSIRGQTLALKSYSGGMRSVMLTRDTKYAWATRATLADIKKGDFIGAASTGSGQNAKAVEVAIFPRSMRGAGEGHYDWTIPASVARADGKGGGATSTVRGNMTNGTVVAGTMTNGTMLEGKSGGASPMVNGTMTNGTVVKGTMTNGSVGASTSESGGRHLEISYNSGRRFSLQVPAGTPVVKLSSARKSALRHGAKVFVLAAAGNGGSNARAKLVIVGKNGLMPPM